MSVKISEAYPSQYLKCADLNGKPWDMKIRTVSEEDLGQGHDKETKPVVYFENAQKGLVLNKTNATTIAKVYGDDTGTWTGQGVQVFPTQVEFKGETVDAIRVRVVQEAQPEAQSEAQPEKQPEKQPDAPMADDELNDEIPW